MHSWKKTQRTPLLCAAALFALVSVIGTITGVFEGESLSWNDGREQLANSPPVGIAEQASPPRKHWPNNFSNPLNLTNSIKRQNLFTTLGGCRVARWVYPHPIENMNISLDMNRRGIFQIDKSDKTHVGMQDCIYEPVEKWLNTPSQFNRFDTVYLPLNKLSHFINYTLPKVTTKIVVISGQLANHHGAGYEFTEQLLSNEYIVHWFVTNVHLSAPNHTQHPKVRSLARFVIKE
jgi:hypothetical protein